MRRTRAMLLLALCAAAATTLHAQTDSYDDVLLIVNQRSWSSTEIGAYFAGRRDIPEHHVYRMDVDSSESMDSATFVRERWKLRAWMQERNLVDSINYIVTTKGCPLRVRTTVGDQTQSDPILLGGLSSFEDALVLMNGGDSVLSLAPRNQFFGSRYFNATERFRRDPVTLPYYLVTRLDGYTVDQVKSYIRRAETPAFLGEGLWVLDVDPGRDNNSYKAGNDWIRNAARLLRAKGLRVLLDTTNAYLHDQQGVIGYGSWGSNDGNSGGGEAAKARNTWLDGSIAETIVSTSGRSFQPGTGYGQSLIADWIAEGACAVKGYTDEPYLLSIAHFDILFDRYTSGFNMAESFYAGSQLAAWRQVVIGDPKMRLRTMLTAERQLIDFGTGYRYTPQRDTIEVTNNLDEVVTILSVETGGDDSVDFASEMSGPLEIPARGTAAVPVVFRPSAYRNEVGLFRIIHRRASDTSDFAITVEAKGAGRRPMLELPDTVEFGTTPGTIRTVTIRNLAPDDTLLVTAVSLSGSDRDAFRLDTMLFYPVAIPGGGSFDFRVHYVFGGERRYTANLNVASSAGLAKQVRLIGGIPTTEVVWSGGIAEKMSVTPNPSRDRSVVHWFASRPFDGRLELVDPLGRTLRTEEIGAIPTGAGEKSIDIRGLASGIYRLRLIDAATGEATVTSLVIEQ